MPVFNPVLPFVQAGDMLNLMAPHNVLAALLTGGQYRTPIYSEETVAEFYNPTQLYNRIPGVTFGYLKTTPYGRRGWIEPEAGSDVSFWVYNNSDKVKTLQIRVNQLLCQKVGTGPGVPCQYERGYPLVYSRDLILNPGGAFEVKFDMYTPLISSKPGEPQQVGDIERVRVEVNVTDESGKQARLAAMAAPRTV